MNPFDDGARAHRAAQQALPWLANGSLGDAEAAPLHAHLRGCARCRDDLELLRALRAAGPGPDAGPAPGCDADRALARLLPRLDPAAASPAPVPAPAGVLAGWRARFAANERRWLRHAVALQAGTIALLALLLARSGASDDGAYHALGAAPPVASGVVVVFRPDTPERELRRIVRASGGHLAGGPTATDAWLMSGGDTRSVLARLRAEPAVLLAQPLGAGERP